MQLFAAAQPRLDKDQIALATPPEPAPLLVQGGEAMVALALAVELLDRVVAAGGTHLPRHITLALRDVLRERFEERHHAHLEEELLRVLSWLKDTFSRTPDVDLSPDQVFNIEARKQMIDEAVSHDRDLFIGYLDPKQAHVQRFRVRPIGMETHEERVLMIASRVPGGDELSLPLEHIRWMLQAQRFHPLDEPELAPILAFPPKKKGT